MLEKMLKTCKASLVALVAVLLIAFAACGSDANDVDYEAYVPEIVETYEPEEAPAEEEVQGNDGYIELEEEEYEAPPLGSNITGAIHRVVYGGNVAYLFGTIHLSMEHWFPLADVVEDALLRADVVLVEVVEIALGTDYMAAAMMEFMFLPDGQTWAEFLPEDAYSHLVALLPEWGMVYEAVNTMNPALLAYSWSLGLTMGLADAAIDLEFSVDSYIAEAALSLGLPVIGLENIEQQMEIGFNPPMDVMVAMVMNLSSPLAMMAEIIESDELLVDDLARLYENNDFQAMIDSWARVMDPEYDHIFVTYMREVISNWRSTYFANEIARLLRETAEPTTFFVAVGLSHIIRSSAGEGFTDIVQQLTLQGFAAEPLWR